ncbi:MAG TPA: hypothetical protein VKM72_05470 [Thermoanaerobaculia bacterium]|nr:hypothetical protein [Thermoanaerobaculia bacterium]
MVARHVAALVFVLSLSASVYAEELFDLGGIQITLGMPEEAAIRALSARFTVRALEGGGDWIAFDQQGEKVGSIHSKQGKIYKVTRDWVESNSEDSRKLADRLFSALANIASEEGASARIVTREVRTPSLNAREIQIIFPGRRIWVTLTDKYGVSVGEAIE